MSVDKLQAKWFGVQIPLDRESTAIAKCAVIHKGKTHVLSCPARTPVEAYFGLRWAIMKRFGVTQYAAELVLERFHLLPSETPVETPDYSSDDSAYG